MLIWPADPTHASQWQGRADETFRIAIVSTPRTGNTWLRRMLDAVYSLEQVVEGDIAAFEWSRIPRRCILQVHWGPEPDLLALLEAHGFRVVTLARHPLDVLISILHYATLNDEAENWYGGRAGDERGLRLATPCSGEFIDYATSPRARLLLDVSRQWMARPDCLVVRYESLVEAPHERLAELCGRLRPAPEGAVAAAVETHRLEAQRPNSHKQHFWQGSPGHWRRFLPEAEARAVAAPHAAVFAAGGYACDPDPSLTGPRAEAVWQTLELASLKRECRIAREQVLRLRNAGLEDRVARLEAQLESLRARLEERPAAAAWRRLRAAPRKLRRWLARRLPRRDADAG
jgi:hypothetical protein